MKAKKATESYKSLVEKYAAAKCEFEQKMAETAQVSTNASLVFAAYGAHYSSPCVCNHAVL